MMVFLLRERFPSILILWCVNGGLIHLRRGTALIDLIKEEMRIYGFPKIQRSSIPLRPILTSINHCSYKIAKFFIPFLTPISTSSFVIKDSVSFVQERLNSDINSHGVVIASFDVTSLFTNIPVDETIEIIKYLPTACVWKALIAHSSSNFYLLL